MSSKLRLSGKGARGTARLSEKEQIDLAIKLSLQQQNQEHQPPTVKQPCSSGLAVDAFVTGQHSAVPVVPNTYTAQPVNEPRKRRAVATRRPYALEESDDGDSQGSGADGQQGADDYKPESSDSDNDDSDDDSDFAGGESDDDRPRKKQKSEASKAKKPAAKAQAAHKKTGVGTEAREGLARRGNKPPDSARMAGGLGARGRKPATAPVATAAPVPTSAEPRAHPPVGKSTAAPRLASCTAGDAARAVHQEDAAQNVGNGGNLADTVAAPLEADTRANLVDTDDAGCSSGRHPSGKLDYGAAVEAVTEVTNPMVPKAKSLSVMGPRKPLSAKGPAQITPSGPKQPPKPSTLINRAIPGTALPPAPFRSPMGASGGASGIKASALLPAGALPYRVPGLRRPGSSSSTIKKPLPATTTGEG